VGRPQDPLGADQRRDGPDGDLGGQGEGLGDELGIGHLAQGQAAGHGLVRADPTAGEQGMVGRLPAHHRRQGVAGGGLGDHAEGGERRPEAGRLGHEGQVTVADHGQAEADTQAVDGGDQRLGEADEGIHEPGEAVSGAAALVHRAGQVGHLAQVLARRERPTLPRQHHHGDVPVGRGIVQGVRRGVVEGRVEGVQGLGAVQGQEPNPAVVVGAEHPAVLPSRS